jgi:hypothetical protein
MKRRGRPGSDVARRVRAIESLATLRGLVVPPAEAPKQRTTLGVSWPVPLGALAALDAQIFG